MNKYLVTFIVPEIEMEFNAYIPNNKKIGTIRKCVLSSLSQFSNNSYTKDTNLVTLIDKETGKIYDNNIYVKDSEINNGSKIIII